jgi:hypothetical protein
MSKNRPTPEAVRAVQDRRRSGGHGLHKDRRTRRARTRSAAVQRAIREG